MGSFSGSRTASPSSLEVKEVSSLTRTGKEKSFTSSKKMGPPITKSQANHTISKVAHKGLSDGSSLGVAKLGMRLRLSHPGMMESGTPIYSSVSKS